MVKFFETQNNNIIFRDLERFEPETESVRWGPFSKKSQKQIHNPCYFHLTKWTFNLCKLLPNYFLKLVVLSEKKQNLAKQALSYYAWKIAISQQLIHSNGMCKKMLMSTQSRGWTGGNFFFGGGSILGFNTNKGIFKKHTVKVSVSWKGPICQL